MQMKMVKLHSKKFDKKKIRSVLEKEDAFITKLFKNLEVPESIEDEDVDDQYLLKSKGPAKKNVGLKTNGDSERAQSAEELQDRMEIMRNKMQSKKSKPSDRALKKKQEKKLKKSKELKKRLISVAKSFKNEKVKEGKVKEEDESKIFDGEEGKPEVKPGKVYNEEGKIVFSKFEFAARASQAKKSKKDKTIKDPKLLLQKIKKQKAQISELIEKGETGKAEELKQDLAWKKAFDKTDGKKVKDNATLLHRSMKKKKTEKKKSKMDWKKREEKVEKDQENRQKKRETNLNKKKDDKKKHKLKKQAKRGRIIAGY